MSARWHQLLAHLHHPQQSIMQARQEGIVPTRLMLMMTRTAIQMTSAGPAHAAAGLKAAEEDAVVEEVAAVVARVVVEVEVAEAVVVKVEAGEETLVAVEGTVAHTAVEVPAGGEEPPEVEALVPPLNRLRLV
eukprot:PhF_6_TR41058/c1_g1_i3/m.62194